MGQRTNTQQQITASDQIYYWTSAWGFHIYSCSIDRRKFGQKVWGNLHIDEEYLFSFLI